jgi:hypothetical protein
LLYKLIVIVLAVAISAVVLLPQLNDIWNSEPMDAIIVGMQSFFKGVFTADAQLLSQVKQSLFSENGALHRFAQLLSSEALGIILSLVGCVIVYLIKRFVDAVYSFSVGSVLSDKMSTYAESLISTAFVSNLAKACVYALVFVPISFLFDVAIIAGIITIFFVFDLFFALFLSMTFFVFALALRWTFTYRWMPAMITDQQSLRKAVKGDKKTDRKLFKRIYLNYVVVNYLVIIVNVLAALATFGSALIITVPATCFYYICQQFVAYYMITGKKYFITYDKIVTNPDKGDSEHFFQYIDQTQTSETSETEEENKQNVENNEILEK